VAATICPRPVTLTFDLLTLKSVWESYVTWGTPVQRFVFLGLLVFELEPMYATSDGQTDKRTTDAHDRLMPQQYSDEDPHDEYRWVGTNRDSGRMAGYRSMIAGASALVYHSYGARLFTAQRPARISEYVEDKRSEQNLSVCSSKSEAEVTNNRRLRSTYCTINANY